MGDDAEKNSKMPTISWTDMLEEYFASTGEKAHCLSWCHKKAEALYSQRKNFIDLPVIVGSGVIAFLNAGSSSLFAGKTEIASIALGVGSLFVGVLNTMGTYFGWAKRAEGHRISSIHYAKLYRYISVEMSLPRSERTPPNELLKYVKEQYDRLTEISPLIPEIVIREFQSKFNKYTDISKPEEANGLEKIEVYHSDRISYKDIHSPLKSPEPSKTPKLAQLAKLILRSPAMTPVKEDKIKITIPEDIKKPPTS